MNVQCQDNIKVCGPIVVLYCSVLYRGLSYNRFDSVMTEHEEFGKWSIEEKEMAIYPFTQGQRDLYAS